MLRTNIVLNVKTKTYCGLTDSRMRASDIDLPVFSYDCSHCYDRVEYIAQF